MSSFRFGLNTYLEPQSVPRGGSPNSMNFLTKGDKVETSNRFTVLGTELAGAGAVTGLFVAHQWDGTELLYRTRGQKLELYDETLATPDWVEIGTDLLGSTASGEEVSFAEYFSPAGAQLWISSPNSDLIKIMTANPKSTLKHYVSATNFRGRMKIKLNRMWIWQYLSSGTLGSRANSAVQLSYIDKQAYTTVTAEARHSGNGSTKTFTGTLAAVTGRRTCFGVSLTDGTETFTDNYLGVLTGGLGGTGTINYTTGAYSVTFNTAPASGTNNITATYQWEDASVTGIADFTRSATRTAGQGATFQQSDGGDLMNVVSLGTIGTTSVQALEYCFHERKAWYLVIGSDDTTAVNMIYRDNIVPGNWRAIIAASNGIYYVDITNKSRPYFVFLEMERGDGLVIPKDISSNILDLANYSFSASVAIEWEKYILFTARTLLPLPASTKNNVMFVFHKELKTWDILDFSANNPAIYKGTLVAGDSLTNNVYTLFSGFDDNGATPNYFWDSNDEDYGIENLKKTKWLRFEGEIDVNQSTDVLVSIDRGPFVKIGVVSGKGSYVDRGQAVLIGSLIVGLSQIGGGGNGATAFHYERELKLKTDKFERIRIRLQPTGVGYFSCSRITHWDIRQKAPKLALKYRGN